MSWFTRIDAVRAIYKPLSHRQSVCRVTTHASSRNKGAASCVIQTANDQMPGGYENEKVVREACILEQSPVSFVGSTS